MEDRRRSSAVIGLLLILLGIAFFAGQFFPGLWTWFGGFSWPLIVIAVGILLLIIGLATAAPGLLVPACIVGGIGGLLYWQNATGNWESWAYAWALIPGFVGVGTVLLGLVTRNGRTTTGGLWLILVSLVLFAVFASFLGGFNFLGAYWPVLLIALGILSLLRAFFGFGRRSRSTVVAAGRSDDVPQLPDDKGDSGMPK
jgi:hypothetical protein